MGIYEVSLPSIKDLNLREKEKEKKGDHGFPVEARSPKNLTKTGIVIYLTIHLFQWPTGFIISQLLLLHMVKIEK